MQRHHVTSACHENEKETVAIAFDRDPSNVNYPKYTDIKWAWMYVSGHVYTSSCYIIPASVVMLAVTSFSGLNSIGPEGYGRNSPAHVHPLLADTLTSTTYFRSVSPLNRLTNVLRPSNREWFRERATVLELIKDCRRVEKFHERFSSKKKKDFNSFSIC